MNPQPPFSLRRDHVFFPGILWTTILLALCLAPGSHLPSFPLLDKIHFDKFVHFCLFGGFVLFWSVGAKDRKIKHLLRYRIFFMLLSIALGIAIEFMQKYWVTSRDYEVADMVADGIGAVTATLLFGWAYRQLEAIRNAKRRHYRVQN